jgi:hypothetical protein
MADLDRNATAQYADTKLQFDEGLVPLMAPPPECC